jgi:hypothetical protein
MWVITIIGFYSSVEKPEDRDHGTLTVRARVREDLEILPEMGPIRETKASD